MVDISTIKLNSTTRRLLVYLMLLLSLCPSMYGQTKRAFYGQQAEDDARDEVTVKVEFGEKTLDSPQTRRRLRGRVKNG